MTGMDFGQDPVSALYREYERRKNHNPLYSQRAFARVLGLPSGRLSELFAKRRPLTPKIGERVAERLGMKPLDRLKFFQAIEKEKVVRQRTKRLRGLSEETLPASSFQELREDIFNAIADWPHYAVLNLVETEGFKSDCRWMGKRLGLPSGDVRLIMDRLIRLDLIRMEGAKFIRHSKRLMTSSDSPSAAIRHWHSQSLEIAKKSLEEVEVAKRDVTSITMPVDTKNLAEAKRLIKNFRRGMSELLQQGQCQEVYNLTIALYPLTKEDR